MKRYFVLIFSAISFAAVSALAQPVPSQPMPGQPIPTSDPNGAYCREYTQQVMIGGVRRTSYGTSCQMPDGSWKIMTSDQQPQPSQQVQYLSPPQYVSAPQYVIPPPVYYQPYPVYAPYRYYGGGIEVSVGHGGWYHGGYYRH